jgi:ubiquinol-cytochrome c reductase cytochrome c1 subunit
MSRKGLIFSAVAVLIGAAAVTASVPAFAKTNSEEPRDIHYSFEGPFGTYDQEQLQRGYKVYHDVCSSCHAMSLLHYRDLGAKGGPFYNPKYPNSNESPYVKAVAKDFQVPDIDQDTGDAVTRPATPADAFKAPFPNEVAARASNGGALPPDLSVIAKGREGGPAYIASLLNGYRPAPKGLTVPAGKYYNPFMPGDLSSYWTGPKDKVPSGGFIAMPFQLTPNRVTYDDGVKATTPQMAEDVSAFLMWAAEPKMEERKKTGFAVIIYLLLFAGVVYASYRRIWRHVGH